MTPFRNTIIHGDCTKALPMLHDNTVDFVLTDPPYVKNYRSDDGRTVRNDNNFAWLRPAFTEIYRVVKRDAFCVCFYLGARREVHRSLLRCGLTHRGPPDVSEALCLGQALPCLPT